MHVMRKLRSGNVWMQVLSEDGRLRDRLAWWKRWFVAKFRKSYHGPDALPGFNQPSNSVRDSINQVSKHARVQLLFAENDPGLAAVTQAVGPGWLLPPGVIVEIAPGIDHSLTGNEMRRVVAELSIKFLRQNALRWPEPSLTDAIARH
jgi:hypothetical protein